MALSNQTWTGLAFTSSARSTTTPASLQCGHRPGIQITGNVFTAAASLSLTQVRRMPVTIKNMIEASEYYLETIYQGIELNWFYCSPRHLCSSTNEPPNAHISSIYLILPALPSLSLLAATAATTNVKHGDEDNKKSGVIIWDFLRAIIKWAGKSEWVCIPEMKMMRRSNNNIGSNKERINNFYVPHIPRDIHRARHWWSSHPKVEIYNVDDVAFLCR